MNTIEKLIFALVLSTSFFTACRQKDAPTFSKDIAPIVYQKCSPCHRTGGVAPFPLITYEHVAKNSRLIENVVQSRFMPPWKPLPGFARYQMDRSLSEQQLQLFRDWFRSGKPIGEKGNIPPPPSQLEQNDDWQMGKPDLIVTLPKEYVLAASATDEYRNFAIPAPSKTRRFVKAWEFKPGTRGVHHAILNIDRTGWARKKDDDDPKPGYEGMDSSKVQSPDGFFLVWTPGKFPSPAIAGNAWVMDETTDLVLELHMKPTGKPETIRPQIGLYFTKDPPQVPRYSLKIGDGPIDIAPGERNYRISDEYTFPTETQVVAIFPHAHYLATKVHVWVTHPNGKKQWLLNIDDWDFNWQDEYTFMEPILVSKGTKVSMEIFYDNSDQNPRNPSVPPRRVLSGSRTTDEMGNITLQLVPKNKNEIDLLRESKYRFLLSKAKDPRMFFNLANALARQKKHEQAVRNYLSALKLDPSFVEANYNLGNLYMTLGEAVQAAKYFELACKYNPRFPEALTNWGQILESQGKVEIAMLKYQKAILANPTFSPALNSLGLLHKKQNHFELAVRNFEVALKNEPENVLARFYLAQSYVSLGNNKEAIKQLKTVLQLSPGFSPAVDALKTLEHSD